MTTREGLMAAILAAPDDDLPRLVFADWLEENGDAEFAEFIRVQIRIADIRRDCSCGGGIRLRGGGQHTNGPCAVDRERLVRPDGSSRQAFLRQREQELRPKGDRLYWGAGPYDYITEFEYRRGFVSEIRCTSDEWYGERCLTCGGGGHDPYRVYESDRGTCPECHGTGRTNGIGPAVVRSHPVTRITFRDKMPRQITSGDVIWEPGFDYSRPHQVSFAIAEAGKWKASMINGLMAYKFPTTESATDAMSNAAIQWAKSVTPGKSGVQQRTEELA